MILTLWTVDLLFQVTVSHRLFFTLRLVTLMDTCKIKLIYRHIYTTRTIQRLIIERRRAKTDTHKH